MLWKFLRYMIMRIFALSAILSLSSLFTSGQNLIGYKGLKLETEFLLVSGRTNTYAYALGTCGKKMLIQRIEYQADLEEDGKHFPIFRLTLADYLKNDIQSHFIGYIIID